MGETPKVWPKIFGDCPKPEKPDSFFGQFCPKPEKPDSFFDEFCPKPKKPDLIFHLIFDISSISRR